MASIGALRVVEREARVWRRLWRGNAFSTFVGPSIFLGAMGLGLGGLIEANNTTIDGFSYLEFVAPGLLAATTLQMAAGDSMWPVMAGTKWIKHYHAMVAGPLSSTDVFLGHLGWLTIRLAMAAAAFLIVATALDALVSPFAILALPAAVISGIAFAAPLTAFSASQDTDARFALVMRFFVLPLFLFSGTFFPISQLPGWLQAVAWVSPLWHGVVLCRSATTGALPDGGVPALFLQAIAGARKPVGEWNAVEIISEDGKLTSILNGKKIGEGTGELKEGPIGFQSEGAEIHFKNIRIKEAK